MTSTHADPQVTGTPTESAQPPPARQKFHLYYDI
jgi:hypothetical protein